MPNDDLSRLEQSECDTVGANSESATGGKTHDYTKTGSSELGRALSLKNPSGLPGQIGPYRIVEKIGEGGMGAVCLAEQTEPIRRQVALKLIKGGNECSSDIIARFEAERQALAMMDHPNIAKILDGGTSEEGVPYFVMELVDGVPLTEYCDRERLTIQQRLQLFYSVCRAVHHAHQRGVIHRDLKPSNVLVAVHDEQPVAKVIDFGLAKAIDRTNVLGVSSLETEFGQLLGTIRYMSPEQADLQRTDIDTRTDIYSLGVILYELLTGTTPLDQQTLKSEAKIRILELIRERDPPRPSTRLMAGHDSVAEISAERRIAPAKLQTLLRGDLDWIAMKALEIDPSRRYETANSFAEDVQHYLSGRAVKARPPSFGYRFQKFVHQHSVAVVTLSIILVTLAAASVISISFAIQANQRSIETAAASEKAMRSAWQAQLAANRAVREKEAQETVTAIMLQVFDAGDPILGRMLSKYGSDFGQATSIAEVVKHVVREELNDQSELIGFPVVRARLLNSLGDICLSSGDVQLSRRAFEKSFELIRGANEEDGVDFAKALMALGTCDYLLGDLARSRKRLEDFLKRAEKLSPEERKRTEVIRDRTFGTFVLAAVFIEYEDFPKTFELLDEVVRVNTADTKDLPVLVDLTRMLTVLVSAYEMSVEDRVSLEGIRKVIAFTAAGLLRFDLQNTLAGPFRGAIVAELLGMVGVNPYSNYQKMHQELVDATGEGHFLTLVSLYGMAVSADRFEDYEVASKHYAELIEIADKKLGRRHPRFAMILQRFANLKYKNWSRNRNDLSTLESARELCREAADIRLATLGSHRLTASAIYRLGRIEFESGAYASAASNFAQAAGMYEALQKMSRVCEPLYWQAKCEFRSGQFDKAVATSERLVLLDETLASQAWLSGAPTAKYRVFSAECRLSAGGEMQSDEKSEMEAGIIRAIRRIEYDSLFSWFTGERADPKLLTLARNLRDQLQGAKNVASPPTANSVR